MKIQFDIKFRSQIESGEYKVFAHEHEEQEARIVCWDNKGEYPIVALVDNEPGKFDKYGRVPGGNRGGEFSLFIVTPEEELSEFNDCVRRLIDTAHSLGKDHPYNTDKDALLEQYSIKLLQLAREKLIKDGYVIEKKAFHDAVEKVSPEVMKGVSDNVDMQIALRTEYEKGRADALKDLPRWRKCADADRLDPYIIKPWIVRFDNDVITDSAIIHHGHFLCFADLEKLPGI